MGTLTRVLIITDEWVHCYVKTFRWIVTDAFHHLVSLISANRRLDTTFAAWFSFGSNSYVLLKRWLQVSRHVMTSGYEVTWWWLTEGNWLDAAWCEQLAGRLRKRCVTQEKKVLFDGCRWLKLRYSRAPHLHTCPLCKWGNISHLKFVVAIGALMDVHPFNQRY